jgi:hypothetical protein
MYQISKFHIEKDIHRHWCPYSEPFTGGDALQSAVDQGWLMISVKVEDFQLSESRKVSVFHVRLQNGEHFRVMRVVMNPYVERFIKKSGHMVERDNTIESKAVART